jgi:S1-C subfamily serine protease
VTSQRNVVSAGSATSPVAEVQFSPSVKVGARVLVADRARDVAVLWIDPGAAASSKPIPLSCDAGSRAPFAVGQKLAAIGAPFRATKSCRPAT